MEVDTMDTMIERMDTECTMTQRLAKDVVLNDTELLQEILKNLNDLNVLLKCRLVNRKWKLTIESIRLNCLTVKAKDTDLKRINYFPDHSSVKQQDYLFHTANAKFMRTTLMQTMLGNLHSLYIDAGLIYSSEKRDLYSFIDVLNHFQQLIQLEIGQLHLIKKGTLRLARLKYLSILCAIGQTLKIDCPNLVAFEHNVNLSKFQFVHAQTIKWCITERYDQGVEQFVNLESYCCKSLNKIKPDVLKLLPALKELHCREKVRVASLKDLLSAKRKLRRLDFNVFYAGLKIETLNDLERLPKTQDGFLFDVDESFQVFLDNYDRLDNVLPYIESIDYNALVRNEHFSGTIDLTKFFGRFVNVKKVELNGALTDKEQFVRFIRRCDLRILKLFNGGLDQEFYEALPACQPRIAELHIAEKTPLDLDFTTKFKSVMHFSINQVPAHYVVEELLDSYTECGCCGLCCSSFRSFSFTTAAKNFKVHYDFYGGSELVLVKEALPKNAFPKLQSTTERLSFDSKSKLLDFVSFLLFQLDDEC